MNINGTCISSIMDNNGPVYVYQTKNSRVLSFDGKIYQSCMKTNNINGLSLGYTQAMMTSLLFTPMPQNVTILGLGAGSIAKILLNNFSELIVHAIEYRAAVVEAAKTYFYLPDSKRLHIYIDDALNYIEMTPHKSDIIFSDLYSSQGMDPKQVQSCYLKHCKAALTLQGILVLNICHSSLQIRDHLDELLAVEFGNRVLRFEVDGGNTIVLAFNNDIPVIDSAALLFTANAMQQQLSIPMTRYAKLLCQYNHIG
ncbi:spermidine synthase [Shewanella youngdeokensis]|uniref:ATP-binding protein n=1 Tax=Shewanella youngdeokensis TaxID=2999068 RepID=A0ABZ0K4P3_9GAMM|nr:ATP-binding protein [Shewanella sp. DAU334]